MNHINETIKDRRKAVVQLAADKALELPLLPSGFWFHQDIRENFYYAIHLFAYCNDQDFACEWNDDKHETARKLSLDMIRKILALQVTDSDDAMYGHWPLFLGNHPSEAKANPLTFEIIGCLLVLFYKKYGNELPSHVKKDCYLAIVHLYKSNIYRQPLKYMVHHGAKHTALKLLLGSFFHDQELMDEGIKCAKQLRSHIEKFGFKEYGSLPWFWHWIQAFSCVWEVVENSEARNVISDLLDFLWGYRAGYYLKGTWVGPHSRQTLHDVPKDNNPLLDYIQFGDFPLAEEIPRLEGSALLFYEVSDDIVKRAINRTKPVETKRKIQVANADEIVAAELHTYVWIDPEFAVGGIWERVNEYENEQHRWDITFPLTQENIENGVNQAFFFHPCEKDNPNDVRHTSNMGEVMYHKDTVMQLWSIPRNDKESYQGIIGCIPLGEWKFEASSGYGRIGNAYVSFQLMNEYRIEETNERILIKSPFSSNWNGVIMEGISSRDAAELGIHDLESFSAVIKEKSNSGFTTANLNTGHVEKVSVSYTSWRNDSLYFSMDRQGRCERFLDKQPVSFHDYKII